MLLIGILRRHLQLRGLWLGDVLCGLDWCLQMRRLWPGPRRIVHCHLRGHDLRRKLLLRTDSWLHQLYLLNSSHDWLQLAHLLQLLMVERLVGVDQLLLKRCLHNLLRYLLLLLR